MRSQTSSPTRSTGRANSGGVVSKEQVQEGACDDEAAGGRRALRPQAHDHSSDQLARLRGCLGSHRRAACEHFARADLRRSIRVRRRPPSPVVKTVEVGPFELDPRRVTNGMFAQFVRQHPRWRRDQVKSLFADETYLQNLAGHPLTWMLPTKISRSPSSAGLQPRRIAKRRGLGCRGGMSGSSRPQPVSNT